MLDLKSKLAEQFKIPVQSQLLEILSKDNNIRTTLQNEKMIIDYIQLKNDKDISLHLKDLGLIVHYQTFYYFVYAFPPIMFLILIFVTKLGFEKYYLLLACCVIGHFLKRILEIKFIHIFSMNTVPLIAILKVYAYYWIIIGIVLPLELYTVKVPRQLWN